MSDAFLGTPTEAFVQATLLNPNAPIQRIHSGARLSNEYIGGYFAAGLPHRISGWGFELRDEFGAALDQINRLRIETIWDMGYVPYPIYPFSADVYTTVYFPFARVSHGQFNLTTGQFDLRYTSPGGVFAGSFAKPGGLGWKIVVTCLFNYEAAPGAVSVYCRRHRYGVAGEGEWIGPQPIQFSATSQDIGVTQEVVFYTDTDPTYSPIQHAHALEIDLNKFTLPQLTIEEVGIAPGGVDPPTANKTSAWTTAHQTVAVVAVAAYRRATMLVFFIAGSFWRGSPLNAQSGQTYNAAALAALAQCDYWTILAQFTAVGNPVPNPIPFGYFTLIGQGITSNQANIFDWSTDGAMFLSGSAHYTSALTDGPQVGYNTVGIKNISLAITDTAGDVYHSGVNSKKVCVLPIAQVGFQALGSNAVRLWPAPGAGATGNEFGPSPLPPTHTNFYRGAGAGATYFWDYGDGTTGSTPDSIHIFPAPGNYVVSLTATAANGYAVTVQQSLLAS